MGVGGGGVVGGGVGGVGGAVGGAGGVGATVVTGGGGVIGCVVTGGATGGCCEVLGGGGCAAPVVDFLVVVPVVVPVEAADEDEFASPARLVKSLENGDQVTGSFGSGNDPDDPSRSTTACMKSCQICAGNDPPLTAMPWTLVMNWGVVPFALG